MVRADRFRPSLPLPPSLRPRHIGPTGTRYDIAAGKPYLYQRSEDGGYKLWGTGIDGKNEGGNETTDVTWTQRGR